MSEILGTFFKYVAMLFAIGAVIGVLYLVFGKNNVATEASNLAILQGDIGAYYNGTAASATLSAANLISTQNAPTNMESGDTLVNSWGGTVTIAADPTISGDADITETGVPQNGCNQLPTSFTSYVSVSVNGGTAETPPIDPATNSSQCVSGYTNTLLFVVGR